MISLLSPAKNLNFDAKDDSIKLTNPTFLRESEILIEKLRKLSAKQISKLFGISQALSELNHQRYQTWDKSYKGVSVRAAILAFNGEVYRAMNASDFNEKELEFANEHLLILSGLHGLLKPLNRIQPYRLEMGTNLKLSANAKNLYQFWGEKITANLNESLKSHKTKFVINLASSEYIKVIDHKLLDFPMINCHFLDKKNNKYQSVMTWAKLARGAMAREIVNNGINDPKEIKGVKFNGYSFNATLSDELNYAFTRDSVK